MKIKAKLNTIGKRISDNKLINFDYKVIILFTISFIVFAILVFFKVNYSSIAQWNAYINEGAADETILFGSSKAIRSDEWYVTTLAILSQTKNNFSIENKLFGPDKTPLIMNIPTKHFSTVFKPQYWGFFVFEAERGYSFFWNFKVFTLFLGVMLFLMILTKNNFLLSVFGSIWILFSASIQWYFSTSLPLMIASASIFFVSMVYLLLARKKIIILISALFAIIFGMNFLLYFYPPFQITLAYLFGFIFIAYLIKNFKVKNFKVNLYIRTIVILLFLAVFFTSSYYFYFDVKDTIQIMQDTAYPGKRVVSGGKYNIIKLFFGYYSAFVNEKNVPNIFSNICQSSKIIIFSPFLFVSLIINYLKNRKINALCLSIAAYSIIFLIYMLIGFPTFLSKFTLLNFIPSFRAAIGFGIASIIWTIVFLSIKTKNKVKTSKLGFSLANILFYIVVFIIILAYGLSLNKTTNNFFALQQILFVSFFMAALIFFIFKKKVLLFFIPLLMFVVLPNFPVNPVTIGLSSLTNKKIIQHAQEINKKRGNGVWLVFERPEANLLKSAGINVFNGTHFIPDLDKYTKLDPQGKYQNIYNRYARVNFKSNTDKDDILFSLKGQAGFTVTVNPCSEKLADLEIKYFVFNSKRKLKCLTPLVEEESNNVWIYQKK